MIRRRRAVARGLLSLTVALAGVTGVPLSAGAQPPPDLQAPDTAIVELRLTDGSVIFCVVQSETPERVVLTTVAGVRLDVPRSQVASLGPARGRVIDGVFRRADSNATRLLFSPTARSQLRGQGHLGVYELVLPFVQVGVTDRLSIGGGTPLVFFGDETSRPVWFTPKYQFVRRDRVAVAAGVMHFVSFGESARSGLAYAVATHGTDDTALTVGAAWAYARYRENETLLAPCEGMPPIVCRPPERATVTKTVGSPVVMIGGEHRLTGRVKLLTENYAFEDGAVLSLGVRFIGDRLAADLGVFTPIVGEGLIVIPIVNVVWTFGC